MTTIGIDGLTLGERLRRARRRLGLEQTDVAAATAITTYTLSRLENDHHEPLLSSFAALAAHYGVPLDALYHGPLPALVERRAS